MPDPVDLFAFWTAKFDVTIVPADDHGVGKLHFEAVQEATGIIAHDPFQKWFRTSRNGQPLATPLDLLVSLTHYFPNELGSPAFLQDALKAARHFGPLFTVFPQDLASNGQPIEEPLHRWYEAAWRLRDLAVAKGQLAKAPVTPPERLALLAEELAKADMGEHAWATLSAESQQRQIDAHLLQASAGDRSQLERTVADRIDGLWILLREVQEADIKHLSIPRPRLHPETLTIQLVVSIGLQALLLMTLHDQTIGHSRVMRACARQRCLRVQFMTPRQHYCSEVCQRAAAEKRRRDALKLAANLA